MANPSMKGIASVLASKGRGGDTMLMHVAPSEVEYLSKLGGITENPDTGLPEALKFKDFLPFLGSAFLGPAFKAVGFSPTVSSILASTAGTMLGGGSLEKGIMSGLVASSLGRLGTALSPEASKAAAADTGYRFGIFKKPTEGGPGFGARYAEAFRSPQFNPIEAAKSATEGGLDKFITEFQKPSVMIPFTTGAGELARMSAAEKYQQQMAEMQRQAEERRRRVYARNPQVIPPSSPYYRPPGMKEGGMIERKQFGGIASLGNISMPLSNISPSQQETGDATEPQAPDYISQMMALYTSQARNDQERQDIEKAIGNVLSFDASRGMTGGAPGAFENYPARLQAATDNIKDQNDFIDQVRPLFEQGKYKEAFDLADKLGRDNLEINRERASLVGGMEFPEESQQIASRYINMLISDGTLRRVSPPMNAEQMGAYYDAIPFDKIPLSEIRGTGSIFDPDAKAKNIAALAGGTGYPDFFKYAVTAKKDVNLLVPTLQILLAFAGVPAALGNTIAGSTVGTALGLGNIGINSAAAIALGSAVVGAAGSVAQGGDFEDALKSALIAGGLGYLTAPQTIGRMTEYLQDAGVLSSDLAKGGVEVVTDAAGNTTVNVSAGGTGVSGGGVSAPAAPPPPSSGPSQEEIRIQAEREAAARAAEEAAAAEAARQAAEAQERARQEQEARESAERAEQERLAEEARLEEIRIQSEAEAAAKLAEEQAAAELARQAAEAEAARKAEQDRLAEEQRLEEVRIQAEREAARVAEEAATAEAARQALEAQEQARRDQEAREAAERAEQERLEEVRIQAEREAARVAEEAAAAEALRQAVEAQDRARLEQEAREAAEEAARAAEEQRLEEIRIQAEAEAAAAAAVSPPVTPPIDEFVIETSQPATDELTPPVFDVPTETTVDIPDEPTPIDADPSLEDRIKDSLEDYITKEALEALLAGLAGGAVGGDSGASGLPGYQGTGGLGYIPEGQERRYIAAPEDYMHGFLPEFSFFENLNPPAVIDTNYPRTSPVDERNQQDLNKPNSPDYWYNQFVNAGVDSVTARSAAIDRAAQFADRADVPQKATGGLVMAKPKVFSPRDYLEMVRGYQVGGLSELPVGEVDSGRNLMTDGNKDLIDLTRAVILGEVEERADEIIQKFIDLYGYEEFQNLRDETLEKMAPGSLKTGLVRGQTGGMDDMVDGVIGNQERVAVSPGEFIVPADVVAALGDGNTEKGGKELEKMMERTRLQKYGSNKQPPPVNLDTVMPA